jgi:PAS domain S-box-containing protein
MLMRVPIFWKLSITFVFINAALLILNSSIFRVLAVSGVFKIILLSCLIIVLSCGFSWFITVLFIKRPMRKIAAGMNKLANKEFNYRLEEREKDEFASLVNSFNDMADMLSFFLAELNKARDYLVGILESAADLIITVNATGKILSLNSGAETALGYNRNELIGRPIEMLFVNPRDREIAIGKLAHKDSVINYETQFVTKDKKARDVLLTISRLRNPAGEIIGTIGISKDITEEKRLQKQLIQSQRLAAIGEVFTGIQHSMKNMLNACKGGSYMIRTGLKKDDRKMFVEGWDIVQEGIEKLTAMSMDMLKYVKEWNPRLENVDISQMLADINRVIEQSAADRGIVFRLQKPNGKLNVLCDSRMIHSAVMDIVSNAIDACAWKEYNSGETPGVRLTAYQNHEGKETTIEVEDNGCGMTEEIKASIFTPFFSTKSKAGTGLGLSITSRMIEMHNGRINVESEPDKGTVFRIILPIKATSENKENNHG